MTARAQKQPTGYQILTSGLVALARELGRPLAVNYPEREARLLTVEAAQALLDHLRKLAVAGEI